MAFKIFVLFSLMACLLLLHQCAKSAAQLNNRPIVGVLFQDLNDNISQIAASSYVKWAEMAGARVVPIFIKRDPSYYTRLLDQINGVLMPGGGTPLIGSGYADAADLILQTAIAKYQRGIHFPIWATCLSFEKVITYFTGNTNLNWESQCDVWNLSLNLDFPSGLLSLLSTRMLHSSARIYHILRNYPVTPNYHEICLNVSTFRENRNLTENFRLVSTNTYNGHHFVSTLEHKKYPIYATQWHPEKNAWEWTINGTIGNINHDFNAVQVGQHFGNFFVNEARKNRQRFGNANEEEEALIYNYSGWLRPGRGASGYQVYNDEGYEIPIDIEL